MNRITAYASVVLLIVSFVAGCSQQDTPANDGTMMKGEDLKEGGMMKDDAMMKGDATMNGDAMMKDEGK